MLIIECSRGQKDRSRCQEIRYTYTMHSYEKRHELKNLDDWAFTAHTDWEDSLFIDSRIAMANKVLSFDIGALGCSYVRSSIN
jgi:hypothetical protein